MLISFKIQQTLGINKNDLVLEVGSGANPLMRSDLLLYKYPIKSEKHRTSQKVAFIDGRPFVVGDVLDLPFLNNSFDLLIARHILEHLSDPERFISEIKRLSKAAYIVTPSPFTEPVYGGHEYVKNDSKFSLLRQGGGTPGHQWFVLSIGNNIFLLPKSADTYPIYLLFRNFILHNTNYERDSFFKKFPDFRETRKMCQNSNDLKIIVLKESPNDIKEDEVLDVPKLMKDLSKIRQPKSLKFIIKSFLSRKIFTTKKKFDFISLLACPICKHPLLYGEAKLICKYCGFFPVVKHIPILLKEALNTN